MHTDEIKANLDVAVIEAARGSDRCLVAMGALL